MYLTYSIHTNHTFSILITLKYKNKEMNIWGLQDESKRPVNHNFNHTGHGIENSTVFISPESVSDHVFPMRKNNSTKPNVVFKVYDCDATPSNKETELRKIALFFDKCINWAKYKLKRIFSEKSSEYYADGSAGEEHDEEYYDEEETQHLDEDREADVEFNADGNARAISNVYSRANLSWPFWTYDADARLTVTGLNKPLFRQRSYYMDLFFRLPFGNRGFNEDTLASSIRINPDTIQAQVQHRIAFSNEAYNILPLSIEVIREKSDLPGIWDKVLVTKGHSPFVPGSKCALSGDVSSVANNPIINGDSVGDAVSTPVMYELHSSYTCNPDVNRLIHVDLDKLKQSIELSINTNTTRKVSVKRNTEMENDLDLIILSYFDEIVGCIKDRNERQPSKIIDRQTESVSVPMVAILEWVTKKKALIDKERKLMDIKDIQLVIKPSSQNDVQMTKTMIKDCRFALEDAEYMCHIRLHYVPLKSGPANIGGLHSSASHTSLSSQSFPSSLNSPSGHAVASNSASSRGDTDFLFDFLKKK